MPDIYTELIAFIKETDPDKDTLNNEKIRLCQKYKVKKIPTDIEVLLNASPEDFPKMKKLQTKPTRSLSGVTVVAVMTKPHKCPHGKCIMCPGGPKSEFGDVPQSYTGKEPATRRAMRNAFDPFLQVWNRLEQYVVTGHVPDKIELIIMGGTFPSTQESYQEKYITSCFQALNVFSNIFFKKGNIKINRFREFFELPGDITDDKRNKRVHAKIKRLQQKTTLRVEQKKNESSQIRCVGLTIETRPDYALLKQANAMLRLGCTRVEIGVQTVYDHVLDEIERGHTVDHSIQATRILKDLGFKINYHMMPGLPGVSKKDDLAGLKRIFDDPDFRPDMVKLYPCMVLKGTKLYEHWKKGRFKPLTTASAAKLIAEFKPHIPEYVRVMRVQRDIPTMMTSSGVDRTNLRQYIQKLMAEKGTECRCIRCREAGRKGDQTTSYKIRHLSYDASQGTEEFISAETTHSLLGFTRLRFPSSSLRPEITTDSAIIRELHVYGAATAIGKSGNIQHRGIGKELVSQAETFAKENGKKKMIIISGVGVRGYYRKLGYRRQGPYMVKAL
jgi:elongator complex protein 3